MPCPSPTIPNFPANLPRMAEPLPKLRIDSRPPIRGGPSNTSNPSREQRRKSQLNRRQKQLSLPFGMGWTHAGVSQIEQKNQSHLRGRGLALI
jgi:hypothetical protein